MRHQSARLFILGKVPAQGMRMTVKVSILPRTKLYNTLQTAPSQPEQPWMVFLSDYGRPEEDWLSSDL